MGRWESRYIQDDINIILIKSQSHIKQTTSYKSATTKKDGVLGCGLAWEALVCCRHRKLAALTNDKFKKTDSQLPGPCDVDDILFKEVSRTCANTKPRAEPIGWSQVRILQFSKTRSSLALWHCEDFVLIIENMDWCCPWVHVGVRLSFSVWLEGAAHANLNNHLWLSALHHVACCTCCWSQVHTANGHSYWVDLKGLSKILLTSKSLLSS